MAEVKNITKRFNGMCALNRVTFTFAEKGILGIAGPNGSGKTTLLNILSGNYAPDGGQIMFGGRRIDKQSLAARSRTLLSRTYQDARVWPNHTVLEQMHMVQRFGGAALNGYHNVHDIMTRVGLDGKENAPAWTLSFGQRRRLELARLLMRSDVLMLLMDEPTNGADPGLISLLTEVLGHLKAQGRCVVVVEHNLDFLTRIADELLILEGGQVLIKGKPEEVLRNPDVERAYLGIRAIA